MSRRSGSDAAPSPMQWDYAPAPETLKVDIRDRYRLFIGGRFVAPKSWRHLVTINPATEQPLAEVAEAGRADVDAAVRAARAAFPAWASLDPRERGKHLFRLARRIQERARELAVLETINGGKPIRESRDVDLPLVAQHFFYHAGWCDKLAWAAGWRRGAPRRANRSRTTRRVAPPGAVPCPIGVCAQIIPWNFPLLMAAWKLAPALACGNTCVLKPAETTPLTALMLAEILEEIDFPPGVVNILTGAGETGRLLVEHPDVDKIAFTGSTEVGKQIARAVATEDRPASRRPKRLTLELGGKSPNIIFEDAALDQAVEGIVQAIFFNQGHVCCAGSRLLVQESVLDDVIARLDHRMASLRVGDPLDKNTDIGAINSKAQLEKIERHLAIGETEGATLHIGGVPTGFAANNIQRSAIPAGPGFWCRPCYFTGVQPSHAIAREEIFGPVLAVMSFRTPHEAIQRANNTPYGLSAGVWTDKGSKILDIARQLKAGVVWCNTFNRFDPASPFGGYRESGFGREGGIHGLRAYLDVDDA